MGNENRNNPQRERGDESAMRRRVHDIGYDVRESPGLVEIVDPESGTVVGRGDSFEEAYENWIWAPVVSSET